MFAGLFLLGGLPAMVWGGCLRLCWVYHITWFVNSAAHVWGAQTYNTGDQSRNNWWVLAAGAGRWPLGPCPAAGWKRALACAPPRAC
jgi:stearoyl-CoA desaturase (delta-9 desaturase)